MKHVWVGTCWNGWQSFTKVVSWTRVENQRWCSLLGLCPAGGRSETWRWGVGGWATICLPNPARGAADASFGWVGVAKQASGSILLKWSVLHVWLEQPSVGLVVLLLCSCLALLSPKVPLPGLLGVSMFFSACLFSLMESSCSGHWSLLSLLSNSANRLAGMGGWG